MAKGKYGFEKGAYGSAKGVRAKATDLTKAQLKRAGAAKAAAKRSVAIGRTSRVAGKTLGPGGKPLTGSVKLASGRMAVYKAGKRVTNVKRIKDSNPGAPGAAARRAATQPPPPKKSISPGMNLTASQREDMGALSRARIAANQANRARITAAAINRDSRAVAARRPSFAKHKEAVAKALMDFKNATTDATKESAKRKYDTHVAILNGIKDYFR